MTIPPVKLDFFDPGTKKYKSIASNAVQLDVKPAAGGDLAGTSLQTVQGLVVASNAKDIRYIKTESGGLEHKQQLILFTPLYLFLNGIPVLALCVIWVNSKRREKYATDIGFARSRAAKKLARKHLSVASKIAAPEHSAQFYAEIRRAMFSYVANKMNISPHGMTGDVLLDILKDSGFAETLISKTGELLKNADFAQYSSAAVSRDRILQSLREAEELLIRLEETKIV